MQMAAYSDHVDNVTLRPSDEEKTCRQPCSLLDRCMKTVRRTCMGSDVILASDVDASDNESTEDRRNARPKTALMFSSVPA